jgi:hypothetical protein
MIDREIPEELRQNSFDSWTDDEDYYRSVPAYGIKNILEKVHKSLNLDSSGIQNPKDG